MMTTVDKAMELARTMVDIGNRTGRRFAALVTDMNQPLGRYVGNALEVEEAIDILSGRTQGELKEVSLQLGAQILRLSGKAKDAREGYALLTKALDEGLGLKKLAEMVSNQGGDPRAVYDTSLLPKADRTEELPAPRSGYITKIHTNMIGYAAKALGAGREKKEDPIDPAAGLIMRVRLGDKVEEGQSLATLMEGGLSRTEEAKKLLLAAIEIGSEPAEKPELIYGVIE
jgi:pyrimidine-nucleoside phosphorylase